MTAIGVLLASLAGCSFDGSEPQTGQHAMGGPALPGACEAPAAANAGKLGCYFDAAVEFGSLPPAVYWHIEEFPDLRRAEAARGASSAVVSAYGRIFLQTISGQAQPPSSGGRHLATVGPMQAPQGPRITARFMQAMTQPGAATRPHRHTGPEGFYILSGAICLETPEGGRTTSAGETVALSAGLPMQLTSAGDELRRSLFVVLHPSSEPWMTMASDWTPVGACAQRD